MQDNKTNLTLSQGHHPTDILETSNPKKLKLSLC